MEQQFVFALTEREAVEITGAKHAMGHEALWQRLLVELEKGGDLTLTSADLGEIVACVAQHREGGFPGRLRRALRRSLQELLQL